MRSMMTRLAGFAGIMALSQSMQSPLATTPVFHGPMCKDVDVIPAGCQRFTYEDGFSTIAMSQAKADKKHDKHLAKNGN